MVSREREVAMQWVLVVVLAVVLFVVAVLAGLWAGDLRRDADRSSGAVGHPAGGGHPEGGTYSVVMSPKVGVPAVV